VISYIIYIVIVLILVFISIIAAKAIYRGIEAKKNLNKNSDFIKNKKKVNDKD
tara:strand:+ start:365 stop:523 length:159 start_codon:yes stop_codon:yes gene_type:complete